MKSYIDPQYNPISKKSSNSNSSEMNDRLFVLQFLQKVYKEHEQQIRSLQSKINDLIQQKQKLQLQLRNLKQTIQTKQLIIDQITKQNAYYLNKQQQRIQKQKSVKTLKTTENNKINTVDDQMYKYVREAPFKIIQQMKFIQATKYALPADKEEKFKGDFNFIVWSRDQNSLEKLQNRSSKFIDKYLKGHENIVQFMLIYSNQDNPK